MAETPQGEDLAVELAAHWRAILLAQPHQMRLSVLVRRQLPLMALALGRRELALPMRVQDNETVFLPKETPEHFVTGHWTVHVDLDAKREWACAMVAVSSKVLEESYISKRRPNLFDEPFSWAQIGVHEKVQDNFRLPSQWLAKIGKHFGKKAHWYQAALGAHIVTALTIRSLEKDPAKLEGLYDKWMLEYASYGLSASWDESKALAQRAAALEIPQPCQVVPLAVLADHGELGVDEALWEYLSDPRHQFGLSRRAAAELIRVPYSTLSSLRTKRLQGRPSQSAQTGAKRGAVKPPSRRKSGKGGDE